MTGTTTRHGPPNPHRVGACPECGSWRTDGQRTGEVMSPGPILSDAEEADLWAKHDELAAQHKAIGAQMVEITRRIIASGVAKARAAHEQDA